MQLKLNPFKSLQDCQDWACKQIDAAASLARGRYLSMGIGQEAVYAAKYADAMNFVGSQDGLAELVNLPWLKAEAEASNRTYKEMADIIINKATIWNMVKGPAIEASRSAGKQMVKALNSMDYVMRHCKTVVEQLEKI